MDTEINQQNLINNLKKCTHFNSCSQNFCPLDFELDLRTGGKQDKCRFMREPKRVKIKEREFLSGGTVMPDAPLKFVPESNLKQLNEASRQHRIELDKIG